MLEKKYLIYQGSVFDNGDREPTGFHTMPESEWDRRTHDDKTGNAVVLQRGLTKDVAHEMCILANRG